MEKIKIKEWDIKNLIRAEYNPRELKDHQYKQLKDSITRFGIVDPILVNVNENRKGIIIGGHQRALVAERMGIKKIPVIELDLTLEKEKELNVRLNKNTGQWDMDALANYFEENDLITWGFEQGELTGWDDNEEEEEKTAEIDAEVHFSEFLNEENNYVVLFFDNEIDWLQAKTHFNLKTVTSKRANGKEWSKGVGRVLNGADYFNKLKNGL